MSAQRKQQRQQTRRSPTLTIARQTIIQGTNPSAFSGQKQPEQHSEHSLKHKIDQFLESSQVLIFVSIFTIYALFGDDIRIFIPDKSYDEYFWIVYIISIILFSAEIILASICQQNYFNSFFFYLDTIATISLLLDIGWFVEYVFDTHGATSTSSSSQLSKAGKASRVGTKSSRIVRIVKLVRLFKLYKHAQQVIQLQNQNLKKLQDEQNKIKDQKETIELDKPKTKFQTKIHKIIQKNRFVHFVKKEKLEKNKSTQPLDSNQKNLLIVQSEQNYERQRIYSNSIRLTPLQTEKNQTQNIHKFEINELVDEQAVFQQKNKQIKKLKNQDSFSLNNNVLKDDFNSVQNDQQDENTKQINDDNEIAAQSKIGAKLQELTFQRVILVVLCIIMTVPLFSLETYKEPITSYDNSLACIYEFYKHNKLENTKLLIEKYIDFHSGQRYPIIFMQFENIKEECCKQYPLDIEDPDDEIDKYRHEDIYYYTFNDENGDFGGFIVIDKEHDSVLNAIFGIVRTIFVSIILGLSANFFSADIETYVLQPIQNMVKKVRRIAQNSLQAIEIEEQENLILEELRKQKNKKQLKKHQEMQKFETAILEKLIIKIGKLLVMSFGEAGSNLIAKNIAKTGDLNPFQPGKRVIGIFAFCTIRNFEKITCLLNTEVIDFINNVASIIHTVTDSFSGQPNQNLGHSFLLVWKFSSKMIQKQSFCELPVLSVVKTLISINNSRKVHSYSKLFKVSLHFGLHQGWAIQCTISSNYKIDALYLGKTINVCQHLSVFNKEYGTQMLLTANIYKELSDDFKNILRIIDRIYLCKNKVNIYTIDICFKNYLGADTFDKSHLSLNLKQKSKVLHKISRNQFKEDILRAKTFPFQVFNKDKQIQKVRKIFNDYPQFYDLWNQALFFYFNGEWTKSNEILTQTINFFQVFNHIDQPSLSLIRYIKSHSFICPMNWEGARQI